MNLDQIIAWDKDLLLFLNGSDSVVWDQFMFLCTKTFVWIPFFCALLYMVLKNNSAHKSLMLLCCIGILFFVAEGVSSGICKPLFCRYRPTHDPQIMHLVQTVNGYRGGLYGFFSSHATNTFSLFMFLSLVVRSWKFSLTMLAWAALHTYTRLYLGVHFPGDVFVGICFGSLWGFILYILYLRYEQKWFEQHAFVSEQSTVTGYKDMTIDVVTITLLISIVVLLIVSFFKY